MAIFILDAGVCFANYYYLCNQEVDKPKNDITMTLKRQICSLLALILMPILSYAYDFEVEGIYYNINPDGETVSVTYREEEESSYSGDVVIPSEVTYDDKTYSVTECTIANLCDRIAYRYRG